MTKKEKRFYPDYLVEVLFVAALTLEVTFVFAMLFPQRVGREINFISQYQPKPEWYFLWLYQFIRYFPGKSAFIGTVLIPVSAAVLLLSVPFMDRGKAGRKKAGIVLFGLLIVFLAFTLIPVFNP